MSRHLRHGSAHLLLASGTASGKTEAAFLPILTLLHENPAASLGVLYIGPTKALINDQFVRLNDLLKEADIPVWHWHGDISQAHKAKLLRQPRGVLQITPESLESLLINRTGDLTPLFADLRFVVIDEVHAFMGSDRGRQIQCQLARLARFLRGQPRRVGLSATLGDYAQAEQWLSAGSERPVVTPEVSAGGRKVRLSVEHFWVGEGPGERFDAYRYIFDNSLGQKCLIFANSRSETESVIAALRQTAERERLPDIYHVHHGSISAPLREAAEAAMRDGGAPAVVAATVTLELGIDIGQLQRVIQLDAPYSVSSFLQRLGRSGRRGDPAEMLFVCSENQPLPDAPLPEIIPWALLQAIAVIQLYLEERWIEPLRPARYPLGLLYHQTMSTLAALGELAPAALAQRVLALPPFQAVSQEVYRALLEHLVDSDHIQRTDEGGLIVGLAGERVVRDFRFYAVFPDTEEYAVREESNEIGSVLRPPPPGERFALAGRTWQTLEVDTKRKLVFVRSVKGRAGSHWHGNGGDVHTRILQRMRRALLEEEALYPYPQPGARERLSQSRTVAHQAGLAQASVLPLGGDRFCFCPWLGSVGYRTLGRMLRLLGREELSLGEVSGLPPYYLSFELGDASPRELLGALARLLRRGVAAEELLGPGEAPGEGKYDEHLPVPLLRQAFAVNRLDVEEVRAAAARWS